MLIVDMMFIIILELYGAKGCPEGRLEKKEK